MTLARFSLPAGLAVLLLLSAPCWAQRAGENALTSAEDAFGTTVGDESVGLYSVNRARGFNPSDAGNVRIEGLYFDTQGAGNNNISLSPQLVKKTTMRIGLTAQSYPFPSPTGIADYSLRMPGDEAALSVLARYGPYETVQGEINAQIPVAEALSLGVGMGGGRPVSDYGWPSYEWSAAFIGRWRPADWVELVPFYDRTQQYDAENSPLILSGGLYVPPKIKRGARLGQDWAEGNFITTNFGLLGAAEWGKWRLRFGAFRSVADRDEAFPIFYFNTQPDGSANIQTLEFPPYIIPKQSTSWETRVSRSFREGPRRHIVHVNARARYTGHAVGGTTPIDLGFDNITAPQVFPKPTGYVMADQGAEYIRQASLGIAYETRWRGVGEFSAGLQRVHYERNAILPDSQTDSDNWLYNATLAAYLTGRLALYASYSRGLEDTPYAPGIAKNNGEGVDASLTSQVDGGVRYKLTPSLTLVAGVFQIEKPYYGIDSAFFYRELGTISHRGFEMSFAGDAADGLTIVSGLSLLRARLSGELIDAGVVGEKPPGRIPVIANVNVQYGPPNWRGFSVDGRVSYEGSYIASLDNQFRSAAVTLVDLGARYRFEFSNIPSSLRLQVANILNAYEWRVGGTIRSVNYTPPRRVTVQLTMDF
ncbi:MAG: TonB-dependent receptor [Amphiplicatus sp.]